MDFMDFTVLKIEDSRIFINGISRNLMSYISTANSAVGFS